MVKASDSVPALLLIPEYLGTLAAVRCLGKSGVHVVVASSNLLAPARWSKWVTRSEKCPSIADGPVPLFEWLMQYGEKNPGMVLYPSSDETAWLIAKHREALGEYFKLYSPPGNVLRAILDKRTLQEVATQVGIAVPRTWYPLHESELNEILEAAPVCVVKPRTQTFSSSHAKGAVVRDISKLQQAWLDYKRMGYAPELLADMNQLLYPMIQEFFASATDGVHSISGFMNQQGELLDFRGSKKVMQFPPGAGVGICFETFDTPIELVEKLAALCRRLGYFGGFEVEFIQANDQYLMIDFNPRYFGQMGFDIARGMKCPWLVHLCAMGEEHLAKDACAQTHINNQAQPAYYLNRIALNWRLLSGSIFGGVNAQERSRWRAWKQHSATSSVDALLDKDDSVPAIAFAIDILRAAFRHPIGFLREARKRAAN